MKRNIQIILLFIVMVFWGASSHALSMLPLNMKMLADLADYICYAKVIGIQTEYDKYESAQFVTYYTLEVKEWFKGGNGTSEIVYKQIADGEYSDDQGQLRKNMFSFPKLKKGAEYVLFMSNAHQVTGLSTAIGGAQGVFEVSTADDGKKSIPSFKKRIGLLKRDLKGQTNNKALISELDKKNEDLDDSYSNFKNIILEALKK